LIIITGGVGSFILGKRRIDRLRMEKLRHKGATTTSLVIVESRETVNLLILILIIILVQYL
jgi:hypothetical protein